MISTSSYRITLFNDESRQDWEKFAHECPEAWLYHCPRLIEAPFDNCNYADWSFSIRDSRRIVGLCVLARSASGFGGSLSGPGLEISAHVNRKEVLSLAEQTIRQLALKARCQVVRFHLSPLAPAFAGMRYYESTLAQLGFSFGVRGDNLDYETSYVNMIDLHNNTDDLLSGFEKGNRNNVKAIRDRLSIETISNCRVEDRSWSDFASLHQLTFERNSLTPYDHKRLDRLRSAVENGDMLLVNAYEEMTCISSILLEIYKGGMFYAVGSCNSRALKIGAMAYIHYTAMLWGKEHGFKWYCMGATSPMVKGNYGDFKKRFGGEKFDLLSGELILDRQNYLRKILLPAALGKANLIPSRVSATARFIRRACR